LEEVADVTVPLACPLLTDVRLNVTVLERGSRIKPRPEESIVRPMTSCPHAPAKALKSALVVAGLVAAAARDELDPALVAASPPTTAPAATTAHRPTVSTG
jgi:hypothetical protein